LSTFTDGAPPSVTPESDHGQDDDVDDDSTDTGLMWLHEEIQRRVAADRPESGGRHARRDGTDRSTSEGYAPRHSVVTPGFAVPLPEPGGGTVQPQTGGLPPREPGAPGRPRPPTPRHPGEDGHGDVDGSRNGRAPEAIADGPDPAATPPAAPESETVPALPAHPLFTPWVPVPDASDAPTLETPLAAPQPDTVSEPEQDPADRPTPNQPEGAGLAAPGPGDGVPRKRVRVVLAERKGRITRPVRTVADIEEDTGVGELLRTNLINSQLAVALLFGAGAALPLAALPLLFALFPEIGRTSVVGLPVPWLLLGFLIYPFLFGLGLWHARAAERVEKDFADHVQD